MRAELILREQGSRIANEMLSHGVRVEAVRTWLEEWAGVVGEGVSGKVDVISTCASLHDLALAADGMAFLAQVTGGRP